MKMMAAPVVPTFAKSAKVGQPVVPSCTRNKPGPAPLGSASRLVQQNRDRVTGLRPSGGYDGKVNSAVSIKVSGDQGPIASYVKLFDKNRPVPSPSNTATSPEIRLMARSRWLSAFKS